MQRIRTSLIQATLCAIAALAVTVQAQDKKVDANGTWTWSVPGRDGGEPRTSTLALKAEGEKVTGKLTAPGRGGGAPTETEITEGKIIKADDITFQIVREGNQGKIVIKYVGKISGDTIKGTIEREGQESRPWEAKRQAAKPAAK